MWIGIAVLMQAMACMARMAIFYMTFRNTAGNIVVAIHNQTSGSLLDCIDIHIEVPRVIMKNCPAISWGRVRQLSGDVWMPRGKSSGMYSTTISHNRKLKLA
jgi:hypothetical protein